MNSLVTIQLNVPICPECTNGLRFNIIMQKYICNHCGSKFKILDYGQTEREFICERIIYESKRNVYVPGAGAESHS